MTGVHVQAEEVEEVADELLARASLAVIPLMRASRVLVGLGVEPDALEACRATGALRRAAEPLHDAADALEEWGEYARLREGRFGRRGVL